MKMNSKSLLATIVVVLLGSMILPIPSHAEEGQYSNETVNPLHTYVPVVLYEGIFYPVIGVKKKETTHQG